MTEYTRRFMEVSRWHLLLDHSEDYRGSAPEGHWVVPLLVAMSIPVGLMLIGFMLDKVL